jgi:hypothetical protein
MQETDMVIAQTQKWIADVVIACNFCPFAARTIYAGTVHYQVDMGRGNKESMQALAKAVLLLDAEPKVETLLLILPNTSAIFSQYLHLVKMAEKWMHKKGYDGVYQMASFHPHYVFAGSNTLDAANYTNRSVYPMLHLLREDSVKKALQYYVEPKHIPDNNINYARAKGLLHMQLLLAGCH